MTPNLGETATVDSPDAEAIDAALEEKQWRLTHILNTHHHFDHAGGNEALKQKMGLHSHWFWRRLRPHSRNRS